jgi:hypothetical protein
MLRYVLLPILLLFSFVAKAVTPVVRNTPAGIELLNGKVSIVLSNDADLLSCRDLVTNTDIAAHDHSKVAYYKTSKGEIVNAKRLSYNSGILDVYFDGIILELKVTPFDDYFEFEVLNTSLKGVDVLTFLDLKLKYDYAQTNTFLATSVALSIQTNHVYYPSGESKEVIGQCASHTGFKGSKLAVVACKKEELWGIVRSIYLSLPPHSVPVVLASGGPFAQNSEANRYDCVIIGQAEVAPSNVPDWIRFYSGLGIKQFDFMIGASSFVQGQFTFTKLGSAKAFKEQIADPLLSAGIISTLHTYSYYISTSSHELLSNPKWQQQLEFRDSFTLSKTISADKAEILVKGDMNRLKTDESFKASVLPYILIDKEIIRYSIGRDGFVSCKRGQCGTVATSHKAGAKVRVIGGYFNYIAPQIGSDLYYEVARRTAVAYNEGGFKGLYFDAIDGLGVHLKNAGLENYQWYYGATFINEVLKHCNSEPLVVEYSHIYPSVWPGRGRGECWDRPKRGYKNFIEDHTVRNQGLRNRNYVTTLGWYDFYPTSKEQPANFSTKYMFSDDVDYLGVKAIAYDQTMVYEGLLEREVDVLPALSRNLNAFALYNNLRMNCYFTDKVKDKLKEGKYEFKLERDKGRWGFKEVVYNQSKLRDIKKDELAVNNPFRKQEPFIRIENLYSSDCSSVVNILKSEDLTGLSGQRCEKTFTEPLDLSRHLGIRVEVKGNGINSRDALCIRLRSSETSGFADYVVRLSFEGTRVLILSNLDNAEHPDLYFKGMDDDLYKTHRKEVDYTKVKYVQVFKAGDCKDVEVKSIEAVPLVSNPITNPSVHVGSSYITFMDTIQSGEYIEYDAGKTAVVYDSLGNRRDINVVRKGRFLAPSGVFKANLTCDTERKNVPNEVKLTVGLYGNFIHN